MGDRMLSLLLVCDLIELDVAFADGVASILGLSVVTGEVVSSVNVPSVDRGGGPVAIDPITGVVFFTSLTTEA